MDTSFRPSATHDWHSEAYVAEWIDTDATRDDDRRPLLRRMAGLIPEAAGSESRILDLGGGYGALSAEVLDHRPDAAVTVLDYSDAMISAARTHLDRFGGRVTYRTLDMTENGWTEQLDSPFDAVVSAFAVHNLDEPERIRGVYRDLLATLRPGGAFLNFDLMFPVTAQLADLYRRDPTRDVNWDPRVSPLSLEAHLAWLREAGFEDVDCLWKDLEQGLVWASRPA